MNNEKNGIEKNNKVLIILLVAFAFLVGITTYYIGKNTSHNTNIVKIENVFADVNNDNLIDLIVSADVILNDGLDF